jgi:hypothetical protein
VVGTYVYVDGLNFYYGAVKGTSHKWVDFEALARLLQPKDQIDRIRYFTAVIKPQYPGHRGPERQNALLRAMRANPLISVHEGHFRQDYKWRPLADGRYGLEDLFRPRLWPHLVGLGLFAHARRRRLDGFPATQARVSVDEEKGSDVNLGTYLVYDALVTKACTKALVLTNDSDLAEPVRLVAQHGVPVGILNPHKGPPSKKLTNAATFRVPFRREIMSKCQMPNTVKGAKGREVHRPKEWR